jgi:hypothetical protein
LLDCTPCRLREVPQRFRGSCCFHCMPENVLAGPKQLCVYQQRHKSAATNNHESNLLSPIYYVFFAQSSQNQYVHNGDVVCVCVCVCAVLEVCRFFRCFISSDLCGRIFRDPGLRRCKDASHFPYIPPASAVVELRPGLLVVGVEVCHK